MDLSVLIPILFSSESPVLPDTVLMRLALHGVWALVLGSLAMLITGKLPRLYRLGLVFFVLLWTLWPGSASLAYWLGLAFQTPSLMSAVICLVSLLRRLRRELNPAFQSPTTNDLDAKILAAIGVVLGWVLLLDTLAWWPVSVYAWGFGSVAFGAVTAFAALFCLLRGSGGSTLPLLVLTLFALSRLPTGNVWDALLDPWLWLALQFGSLIKGAARLLAGRAGSPATRA